MRRLLLVLGIAALMMFVAGVGTAVGRTTASSPTTPATASGPAGMMSGTGMVGMQMGGAAMDAMHASMHASMAAHMPAEVLARCDAAHEAMSAAGQGGTAPSAGTDHQSHHQGA